MKDKIDKETKELLKHLEKELKESAEKHLSKRIKNKGLNDFITVEIEDEKEKSTKKD